MRLEREGPDLQQQQEDNVKRVQEDMKWTDLAGRETAGHSTNDDQSTDGVPHHGHTPHSPRLVAGRLQGHVNFDTGRLPDSHRDAQSAKGGLLQRSSRLLSQVAPGTCTRSETGAGKNQTFFALPAAWPS